MLPYSRGIRTFRLDVVKNYLINYFAVYARLMCSRIRVEVVSPTIFGLRIIEIIILSCLTRLTRSRTRVELASPAYLGL